jgi:hypothetical protein
VGCVGEVPEELAPQRDEVAKGRLSSETKPTSGGEVVANADELEPNDINDILN